MANRGFERCDKVVAKWEGGKVDHPRDPGGRTAYGVTQRVYDAWRRNQGKPRRDVYLIDEHERKAIYVQNYWKLCRAEDLPAGLDLCVYDTAVNSGVSRAVKLLQASLNARLGTTLAVDGVLGDATLQAVNRKYDVDLLCAEYCARRLGFLQGLRTWPTFGRGWSARVAGVKRQSMLWAEGSVGPSLPVPSLPDAPQGKATDGDVATTQASVEESATATGGLIVATQVAEKSGVSEKLGEAVDQLTPFTSLSTWIGYIVTALIVAAVAYTIWTAIKSWRASRVLKGEATADVAEYRVANIEDEDNGSAQSADMDTLDHQGGDGAVVRVARPKGRHGAGARARGRGERKTARKRRPATRRSKRAA